MTTLSKARARLVAARKDLEKVIEEEVAKNGGKPIDGNTNQRYIDANQAVINAELAMPWFAR